jgi:hypothetical protein
VRQHLHAIHAARRGVVRLCLRWSWSLPDTCQPPRPVTPRAGGRAMRPAGLHHPWGANKSRETAHLLQPPTANLRPPGRGRKSIWAVPRHLVSFAGFGHTQRGSWGVQTRSVCPIGAPLVNAAQRFHPKRRAPKRRSCLQPSHGIAGRPTRTTRRITPLCNASETTVCLLPPPGGSGVWERSY